MVKEAYIYTYTNKNNGKTYIGSRSAYKGSYEDDFNVKYFSSSKDEDFLRDMDAGLLEGCVVLVIKTENAAKRIVEIESQMITSYWDKYGKDNSYNRHNNRGGFSMGGRRHTAKSRKLMAERISHHPAWNKGMCGVYSLGECPEETRHKISIAKKGKTSWAKGKHFTKEHRKHLSEAQKGRQSWNKGGHVTEETKQKIREHHFDMTGYHHSDETKCKIGDANKVKTTLVDPTGRCNVNEQTLCKTISS